MEGTQEKKSFFESSLVKSKIRSANVTFWETIVGYMLGPIGGMLASAVFAFYLFGRFYPDIMFAEEKAAGVDITVFLTLLPLISVITILLGNILLGQLIQKTNTKAGKARPWIPISAVFLAISTILMFLVPQGSTTFKYIYAAITYNLYYAFSYPLYYTANSTLLSQSTRNIKQRDLLSGAAGLASTAAVGIAQMFFPIVLAIFQQDTVPQFWFVLAVIVGVLSLVTTVLQFYFTRERVTEEEINQPKIQSEEAKLPLGKQFKAVSKDHFWWIILIFFLIFETSGQFLNNAFDPFCQNSIDNSIWINMHLVETPEQAGNLTMSALGIIGAVPMALAGVIAWPLLKKFNKQQVVGGAMVVAFVGGIIQGLLKSNPIFIIIGFLFKQLGRGVVCLFIMSMISDVNDHDEAVNGFRCAALTMSLYSAFRIIAQPIGQGMFMAVSQAKTYLPGIEFSFIWVDTIIYAVSFILLLFFGVEKGLKADQEAIVERQKAEAAAAGIEWIEPAERLRLEQEKADQEAEENRIKELKEHCEKKGLNFEEEEAKYQAKLQAKASKGKK